MKLHHALIVMSGLLLSGCDYISRTIEETGTKQEAKQVMVNWLFQEEHRLHRMWSFTTAEQFKLAFALQMNDGTYALVSLPLEYVRVKFNEQTVTPTIKFHVDPASNFNLVEWTPQRLITRSVSYAVITIRECEWPAQIAMPLGN